MPTMLHAMPALWSAIRRNLRATARAAPVVGAAHDPPKHTGVDILLPFLPMLPTQILLNNFLYDLSQVTIPSDNVDPGYVRRPQRWDIRVIRDFMLFIDPIRSAAH